MFDATVTAGTATVAPVLAFTTTTTQCGPATFVRLRAAPSATATPAVIAPHHCRAAGQRLRRPARLGAAVVGGRTRRWTPGRRGRRVDRHPRRVAALTTLPAPSTGAEEIPTTGLELWLDADDASTFTYSSGTVVSQWNDKSGTAQHFAQATGANQPNRNGTQNGHTTVVFDGSTDTLSCSVAGMVHPVTMFAVARNTASSGQRNLISYSSDGRIFRTSGGTIDIYQGSFLSSGTSWGTTDFHSVSAVFNGASSLIAVDGGSDTTGTSGGGSFDTGSAAVGALRASSSEYWQGDIAELIVYDRALSSGERSQVEDYLAAKWFGTSDGTATPAVTASTVTLATVTASGETSRTRSRR